MPDFVWNLCEYRSGFYELSIKGAAFRRIFLVCVTVAVGMFVYFGLQKEKYEVEEYNKRHDGSREKGNAIVGKASGVIMLLSTAVFLYFGLVWDMFRSAWIVYPIGGILCAVVAVIWGDKKG